MPSTRNSQSLARGSTCRLCGKSIRNEASIKRHERYCRKRLTCPAPPRRKSCTACIRAKSRCDLCTPACGPCRQKGKSCSYSSESLSPGAEQSVLLPIRLSTEQQATDTLAAMPISCPRTSQSTSVNASRSIIFEESPLGVILGRPNNLSSESSHSNSTEYGNAAEFASRKSDMPSTLGTLEVPCHFTSHLLRPRDRRHAQTELVSQLISRIICSFPERQMNEYSCPPFIHHSAFGRSSEPMSSEDPIVFCQNITRAARKSRGDISIWKAIASEQERIYDQRGSSDRWFHLSSAQAITIYLLMLVAEGESVMTHHPDLAITLLFTLGANFKQLNQIHPGFVATQEQDKNRPTWKDWIFAESKLRTATVYFILALYFDVDFGIPCDRESDYQLDDVDLPASKVLWEAKSELEWRKEFEKREEPTGEFILDRNREVRLKYGDLLRHNKQQCGYAYPAVQKDYSAVPEGIDRWQKEMDEFGILVALCSTVV